MSAIRDQGWPNQVRRTKSAPAPRARQDGLLVKVIDDEMVVYDEHRYKAHCLNPTAALVWEHCDGETTIAELAPMLANELSATEREEVVWLALDGLASAHLLQEPVVRPESETRPTRRELMRRLARAGGALALLPAVESIVLPTPAQAQSPPCLPENAPCMFDAECCSAECQGGFCN